MGVKGINTILPQTSLFQLLGLHAWREWYCNEGRINLQHVVPSYKYWGTRYIIIHRYGRTARRSRTHTYLAELKSRVLRLPSGTSSSFLYLPVSSPCCSGEYANTPMSFCWQRGKISYSVARHSRL